MTDVRPPSPTAARHDDRADRRTVPTLADRHARDAATGGEQRE
ncbi:hypothetical protein [Haloglomus halophilum]|nr:hypothetical protein [Haloglomus halophilum]